MLKHILQSLLLILLRICSQSVRPMLKHCMQAPIVCDPQHIWRNMWRNSLLYTLYACLGIILSNTEHKQWWCIAVISSMVIYDNLVTMSTVYALINGQWLKSKFTATNAHRYRPTKMMKEKDSCFSLIGSNQHGNYILPMYLAYETMITTKMHNIIIYV